MNEEYIKRDNEKYDYDDLIRIVHKLRQPDGCPWDKVQTYETLKKCVTNETAELESAVDNKDAINLKEELGDLLLLVIMYSDIAGELGDFTLEDVINDVAAKMIRRHPRLFGNEEENIKEYSSIVSEGVSLWNAIKLKEKKQRLEEYEKLLKEGKIARELLDLRKSEYKAFCDKINQSKS